MKVAIRLSTGEWLRGVVQSDPTVDLMKQPFVLNTRSLTARPVNARVNPRHVVTTYVLPDDADV